MKLVVVLVVLAALGCAWALWRSRQLAESASDDRATSADTNRRRAIPPETMNAESARIAKYVTAAVAQAGRELTPGMTTQEVARLVLARLPADIEPAMLGFNGFPAAVSISVNEEVLHGIPSDARRIAEGDLVKIQLSGKTSVAFGAIGWTFAVGRPGDVAKQLLDAGLLALEAAVARIGPDVRSGDIGAEIQPVIEQAGFAVVRDYVGYTIGAEMIQGPQVPCFGVAGQGPRLKVGSVVNVHVIAKQGDYHTVLKNDQWTVAGAPGEPSALFTAMVLITPQGREVLTPMLTDSALPASPSGASQGS